MSSAVANSRAAADWASKRKAALERAARIKAEREALRATEKQENEQQPESSSTVQHGRRTLGTLAPAGADDDYGLQRSFSAAAGGQQQMERRSSGEELPMRPTTDSRPQWARDLARGPPPPQFHDEYDDRSSSPAGPAGWDWYREPGGGDDAAAAAAASRFPRNMPLNQSDVALVPFAALDSWRQEDIDSVIARLCPDGVLKCKSFDDQALPYSRDARVDVNVGRSMSTKGYMNAFRQLHTEMRVARFMASSSHDVAIAAVPDLHLAKKIDAAELHRAVATGDKAMVARANGVGPKLAQRIVNELKDKIGAAPSGGPIGLAGAVALPAGSMSADALSALQNLGFKPTEASSAVAAAEEELGEAASLDALVRLALRKAAK